MTSDKDDFRSKLREALRARRTVLERVELPKLKENFGAFHTGLSALCDILVKKGTISEDPYKSEPKTSGELRIPDTSPFIESTKREQLGRRLSELDSEIVYFLTYYSLTLERCTQDSIKLMLSLVQYIDWLRFSPESGHVTCAMSELLSSLRRAPNDQIAITLINEAVAKIEQASSSIVKILNYVSDFNREQYKYDIRVHGIGTLNAAQAQIPAIKKNFLSVFPDSPFYRQLAEEVLKEDFSPQSAALQESVLKTLNKSSLKTKTVAKDTDGRTILIEGLNAAAAAAAPLGEALEKLVENNQLTQSRHSGFLYIIKKFILHLRTKDTQPVFYDLEYIDPLKSIVIRERVNYVAFAAELEKKVKIFAALAPRGAGEKKIEVMDTNKLLDLLQRTIKDINACYRTLTGFDEYFKASLAKSSQAKVRGIKPELGALKIAASKAGDKLFTYNTGIGESA